MTRSRPPALATWLLDRLTPADRRDAFVGDLVERYAIAPSDAWYWRQVAAALWVSATRGVCAHKLATFRVVAGATMCALFFVSVKTAPVDLQKGLRVDVVANGWTDKGLVLEGHKIVPMLAFTMTNRSAQPLSTLQINALFRRADTHRVWSAVWLPAAGYRGLKPDSTTDPLIVRAPYGYTGATAVDDLLQHSQFVDVTVDLFAKDGSGAWTRIATTAIARRVLAR